MEGCAWTLILGSSGMKVSNDSLVLSHRENFLNIGVGLENAVDIDEVPILVLEEQAFRPGIHLYTQFMCLVILTEGNLAGAASVKCRDQCLHPSRVSQLFYR